jgi:hypothetical protein
MPDFGFSAFYVLQNPVSAVGLTFGNWIVPFDTDIFRINL